MKISELIAHLELIAIEHGDIEVYAVDGDCCGCASGPLKPIEIQNEIVMLDGSRIQKRQ